VRTLRLLSGVEVNTSDTVRFDSAQRTIWALLSSLIIATLFINQNPHENIENV